jgi:hypothetical protein
MTTRGRRTATAIIALCALGLAAGLASTAPSRRPAPPPTPTRRPAAALRPNPKPAPEPGRLPQTHVLPPPTGPAVERLGRAVLTAVAADRIEPAVGVFFPLAAYLQVKAIPNPAADYRERLLGELRLDVEAAHALVAQGGSEPTFVELRIPQSYAHWVEPGTCYNRIGYYEVPNSRLLYRQGGELRSFGIASLISWRGVWYLVHLGAVERPAAEGVVDEPAVGPGTSRYLDTC